MCWAPSAAWPRLLVGSVKDIHVMRVVMGETGRSRPTEFLHGDIIKTVPREPRDVDVYVISRDRERSPRSNGRG